MRLPRTSNDTQTPNSVGTWSLWALLVLTLRDTLPKWGPPESPPYQYEGNKVDVHEDSCAKCTVGLIMGRRRLTSSRDPPGCTTYALVKAGQVLGPGVDTGPQTGFKDESTLIPCCSSDGSG